MNLDRFPYTLHRPGVDWDAVRERLEALADYRDEERKERERDEQDGDKNEVVDKGAV